MIRRRCGVQRSLLHYSRYPAPRLIVVLADSTFGVIKSASFERASLAVASFARARRRETWHSLLLGAMHRKSERARNRNATEQAERCERGIRPHVPFADEISSERMKVCEDSAPLARFASSSDQKRDEGESGNANVVSSFPWSSGKVAPLALSQVDK